MASYTAELFEKELTKRLDEVGATSEKHLAMLGGLEKSRILCENAPRESQKRSQPPVTLRPC
jgi:hypothetical protein